MGLSGYARSGKGETARILVEEYGFTEFAFADKLRECLYTLNCIVVQKSSEQVMMRVQDIIDAYGWEGYKNSPYKWELRRLVQTMGTEVGRGLLDEDIWVRELDKVDSDKIVVTDARFPNEARKIESLGGELWRIDAPGIKPINSHESETALDEWNFSHHIMNKGSLLDLKQAVYERISTKF